MLKKLAMIDQFHLGKLGRFITMLRSTREGGGSMLDQTIILFGSGMNSGEGGEHSPRNLPLLVAGGHSLGLKHNRHLAFQPGKNPPLANLLVSLANKLGQPLTQFADSTGELQWFSN